MRTRKRKKKTRIGANLAAGLVLLCWSTLGAGAGKQKKAPEASAVIAGTVFRDSGFALPGAQVKLAPADAAKPARKSKKMEALTNSRGEFAFRVPAAPAQYKLTVTASGYRPQEKLVSVAGEESADVFFLLEPASK